MFWVGVVAAVVAVAWFVGRRTWSPRPAGIDRLVALCHNDRDLAERLVASEDRRTPGRDRRELIERAIQRLLDDRRR